MPLRRRATTLATTPTEGVVTRSGWTRKAVPTRFPGPRRRQICQSNVHLFYLLYYYSCNQHGLGETKGDILNNERPRMVLYNRGMPRTARASVGGTWYQVLNRGKAVFHKPGDHDAFVEAIVDARARLPVDVLGYCLIHNYFHMLMRPQADGDLGRWVLASSIQPSIDPATADKSSQDGRRFLQFLVESTGGFHGFGTIQSLKPEQIIDSILKSDA
jgi:hypothetical protein